MEPLTLADMLRKHLTYRREWAKGEPECFTALLSVQDGECGICDAMFDRVPVRADHHHQSGLVRGLLCNHCNTALGWYEARRKRAGVIVHEEFAQRAERYLQEPPVLRVEVGHLLPELGE